MKSFIYSKSILYISYVIFVSAIFAPNPSYSKTLYVSTIGDNSNPGTKESPFRTIKRGIRSLTTGDTLYVRSGEYLESVLSWQTPIPHGTSWDNPVTIAAFPGDTVTIKAPSSHAAFWIADPTVKYLIIDGFIINGERGALHGIKFSNNATHIRVQNSEIKNSVYSGVLISPCSGCPSIHSAPHDTYHEFINLNVHHNGSSVKDHGFYITTSYNLVEHCDIHHNATAGGKFYNAHFAPGTSASTAVNHNTLRYNKIHDNSQNATYPNDRNHSIPGMAWILASGEGNEAYANVIYNQPQGFLVGHGAKNALVYNNIVHSNSDIGIWVHGSWGGSTSASIFNNTVYNNGEFGILVEDQARNTLLKNNISFKNGSDNSRNIRVVAGQSPGTVKSNNLIADPKFINVSDHNFKLQSESPAINAGIIIPEVNIDFFGVQRGQDSGYDIGAIEWEQGIDTTPPSTPVSVNIS